MICHICGKNHYDNRYLYNEEIIPGNYVDKAEETPKKEIPPTKASINLMIGENWEGDTKYGGLMLFQVTAGNAV